MTDDSLRSVDIERTRLGRYVVTNARGGELTVGTGDDDVFTPVELLLAAIGACTGIDVDLITSRRAEPATFTIRVTGDKVRDETGGNVMRNLGVTFTVGFPDGEDGDAARAALPRTVELSHDRLCTVSRTVEVGTPVATRLDERSRP